MKTIYLLIAIAILSSCSIQKNTYVNPLPNTPKFTASKEIYANGAVSPTHIEFQGGASLTKNIGIVAGRFYGGRDRTSNELGLNLFTKLKTKTPIYLTSTFGWNGSRLKRNSTDPLNSTSHTELDVAYTTWFVQPGIYYGAPTKSGNFLRAGLFVKCGRNNLSQYYFRDYETEFHSTNVSKENTYTSQPQNFTSVIPTASVELTSGVFSMGMHLGYTFTSKINTQYMFNSTTTPSFSRSTQSNFNYSPFIASCYIGLRL